MQSVLSRIWTRVVESISYNDNYYTTGSSFACLCPLVMDETSFLEVYRWFLAFNTKYQATFNKLAISD